METTKPFDISKAAVWRAWELVKTNDGAEGVDGETIRQFESNLKGNLYKLWNRMSSGSYFPIAVRTVAIPKKDDGLAHCRSEAEALAVQTALAARLQECGLELHPVKTKIVYCKDDDRRGNYPNTSFDFLGFTFRPRRSKNRFGKFFVNFSPAMSAQAGKAIRQEVRKWQLHLRSDKSLLDLALMFRSRIQGWINFYGRFYKSAMYPTLRYINRKLCLWATRKYKKLQRHRRRAEHRLGIIAKQQPGLFPHWRLGVRPSVE